MAYSRANRLLSKQDFQAVFDNAIKLTHQYLQVLFHSSQSKEARLGIIIAKHLVPRAVDRNRIRRIIRESFRLHKTQLKGLDIVVLMRGKCADIANPQLRIDIEYLWQNILNRLN